MRKEEGRLEEPDNTRQRLGGEVINVPPNPLRTVPNEPLKIFVFEFPYLFDPSVFLVLFIICKKRIKIYTMKYYLQF